MIPASEALYFDNAPLAHVVAHEERQRLARIERECRQAVQASRTWSAMADRLAADHRDYRARLAVVAARTNGGKHG